ncbi:MAG: AsmA family protein [Desulfobacterales bacterium]|nr:AsmA family protein [Desulfobacterales bacterium]
MKKLGIVVGIIVVIFVLLLVFKNILIKLAIEQGTKKATGLELTIGTMDVGLLASKVDVTDMRLLNPAGFPDKVMIDISKVLVDVELASLFKQRVHVETLELNLNELMVVQNKERKLNIESLTALGQKKQEGKKPVEQKEAKQGGKAPQVTIDKLILKIGRVTYKDYSLGGTPFTKTFTVGINEVYRDVTDLNKLVKLIIVRALEGTGIAQLANFDLGSIKGDVADTLQKGVSGVTEAGKKELQTTTEEATKKLGEEATKSLEKQLKFE